MEAALKLKEHGWKAEQSQYSVMASVPQDFKAWFNQKKRWCSGLSQSIFSHWKVFAKNPLAVLLALFYTFLAFYFFYGLYAKITLFLFFPFFSFLFIIYDYKYYLRKLRFMLIFPYSLVYYPLFILMNILGFCIAVKNYRRLKRSKRAW